MKLLYTITGYPPAIGGAQIHTHLLIQQIKKEHDVTVACHWSQNRTDWLLGTTLNHPAARQYVIDDVPVNQLGLALSQKLSLLPYVASFYPLMEVALPPIYNTIADILQPSATQTDLIHNVRMGREGLSWASYSLAKRKDIPFVLTPLHHPRWKGWQYRKFLQLYKQADAVIALTTAEKKTLIDLGINPNNVYVTGIGPVLSPQDDPESFRSNYDLTEPLVLFLGQHYAYKGYRQLLDATAIVWLQHPDTHFVFMGPAVGKSEEVFAECSDPRIHRLGAVSLQDKTNALAACTLLCVPSVQESFGGVYTEAWHFGKPVIGGNIPPIADVIQDNIDGYLVEQQPNIIADRIIDLLNHPDKAAHMGKAGQKKTEKYYTWHRLAAATEQVYRSVV
jgi:glycosyltransferase involved in cell wall biosynthesis